MSLSKKRQRAIVIQNNLKNCGRLYTSLLDLIQTPSLICVTPHIHSILIPDCFTFNAEHNSLTQMIFFGHCYLQSLLTQALCMPTTNLFSTKTTEIMFAKFI